MYGGEKIDNNDDDGDDDAKTTNFTVIIYSFCLRLDEHNAIYCTILVEFYPRTVRFRAPII